MNESTSHKRAKEKAAGKEGKTEVSLSRGRKLDALSKTGRATEVERSGTANGLNKAAQRLKDSKATRKVLQVPQHHMPKAVEAMKNKGVKGTVKNMGGTKRKSV